MASLIWNWRSVSQIIQEADKGIFSETYDRDVSLLRLEKEVLKQSWMATIGMGINVSSPPKCDAMIHTSILSGQVILGDAVVWWRVWVIWRHRAIYFAGAILLLVTLGMCEFLSLRGILFTLSQF